MKYPVLSITNKHGKCQYWQVETDGDCIVRKSWIEGGKVRIFPTVKASAKNVGRANETTPEQQAELEAKSMWNKKRDQGYSEIGITKIEEEKVYHPMLAQKYTSYKHRLVFPCAISRKLDGCRAIAYLQNGKVVLQSRNGKHFQHLQHIRDALLPRLQSGIILDGELYSHELDFNTISGCLRRTTAPHPDESKIEYWIFDLCDTTYTYTMRYTYLLGHLDLQPPLRLVEHEILQHPSQIQPKHDQYVQEGYEGAMLRNLLSKYRFKYRSTDLLKYKTFNDDEYRIIGYTEGVGTEAGAIVFQCETEEGDRFQVRPKGSIEYRREQYENGLSYIGKMLTVRYQDTEESKVPRFPIGLTVRDYE